MYIIEGNKHNKTIIYFMSFNENKNIIYNNKNIFYNNKYVFYINVNIYLIISNGKYEK
jgi:hypothetical protein